MRLSHTDGDLELRGGVLFRIQVALPCLQGRVVLPFFLRHPQVALETLVNLRLHLVVLHRSSFEIWIWWNLLEGRIFIFEVMRVLDSPHRALHLMDLVVGASANDRRTERLVV